MSRAGGSLEKYDGRILRRDAVESEMFRRFLRASVPVRRRILPRTSISSSSVSEAESSSEVSHARINCSFCGGEGRRDGTVRWVCDDAAELALPARELGCEFVNEAAAAADANDDPALGATGSSTTVVRKLSHCN